MNLNLNGMISDLKEILSQPMTLAQPLLQGVAINLSTIRLCGAEDIPQTTSISFTNESKEETVVMSNIIYDQDSESVNFIDPLTLDRAEKSLNCLMEQILSKLKWNSETEVIVAYVANPKLSFSYGIAYYPILNQNGEIADVCVKTDTGYIPLKRSDNVKVYDYAELFVESDELATEITNEINKSMSEIKSDQFDDAIKDNECYTESDDERDIESDDISENILNLLNKTTQSELVIASTNAL